jgi:peptidoglycan/LPS O-acetylase OafA/YrhL
MEAQLASTKISIIAISLITLSFAVLMSKLQPGWKESNYMLFALMIFLAGWMAKGRLSDGPIISLLAELTYAVYLLHNWVWHYLLMLIERFSTPFIPNQLQVLILLLLICYAANKTIESSGLKLGRVVLNTYKNVMKNSKFVMALKLEARKYSI